MDKFLLYHTYLTFYNYSATKFFTSLENSVFLGSLYPLFYFLEEQHTAWFYITKISWYDFYIEENQIRTFS